MEIGFATVSASKPPRNRQKKNGAPTKKAIILHTLNRPCPRQVVRELPCERFLFGLATGL